MSEHPDPTQTVLTGQLRQGYQILVEALLAYDGELKAIDRVQLNQALGYVRRSITRIEARLPPTWE